MQKAPAPKGAGAFSVRSWQPKCTFVWYPGKYLTFISIRIEWPSRHELEFQKLKHSRIQSTSVARELRVFSRQFTRRTYLENFILQKIPSGNRRPLGAQHLAISAGAGIVCRVRQQSTLAEWSLGLFVPGRPVPHHCGRKTWRIAS